VLDYLRGGYFRSVSIIEQVRSLGDEAKVLDIGIAYGFHDIVLKSKYGMDITGLELEENIPVYCGLCIDAGIRVVPGRISSKEPLPFSNESYDVIILSAVLEHLRVPPLKALGEMRRILRPSGHLLLLTPNIARLGNIMRLVLGRNILELVTDDAELDDVMDGVTHVREYTMSELKWLLSMSGFTVVKKYYLREADRYNPYFLKGTNFSKKARAFAASVLTKILPWYRSNLMILAQKKA
jgi:SAM-dependent methyltransferase